MSKWRVRDVASLLRLQPSCGSIPHLGPSRQPHGTGNCMRGGQPRSDLAAFIRLHERQRLLSGAKTSAGPHLHIGDMGAVDAVASRTAHGIALTGDDPCLNRRGHPRKGGRSRHRGCTAACRQYEKQYSGQMPAATAFECRVQRFEELSACVRQVDECHSHRRRFYRLEKPGRDPNSPGSSPD